MRGTLDLQRTACARRTLSRWPARLDVLQSATGLALALFMLVHTLFAATILFGVGTMEALAQALEGRHLFGRSMPLMVIVVTLAIFGLFITHAVLAARKLPASHRELSALRDALRGMRHSDSNLWAVQSVTGVLLLFFATAHLLSVLFNPDALGPLESAQQVWQGRMGLLYLVLLPATELHVGIGLYRLAMKWGWFPHTHTAAARRGFKRAMWLLIGVYLTLGFAALFAYARLGMSLST